MSNSIIERDAALALLLTKGVELVVSACGCCDSPSVRIVVDGVVVLEGDNMNLPPTAYEREERDT